MRVNRKKPDTARGPEEWFTGVVYIDTIAAPGNGSRIGVSSVHFTPGARTAWHTHPRGQIIYVTEGQGLVQRRSAPIEAVQAGEGVSFEAGEDHWHGADAAHFMTHLSIVEADEE